MQGGILIGLGVYIAGLGVYTWRARPRSSVHQWFGAYALSLALWVLAIAGLQLLWWPNLASRLAFASASLIPPCLLAFTRVYPSGGDAWRTRPVLIALAFGCLLAIGSLVTDLIVHDVHLVEAALQRQTGPLYPAFALYFLTIWVAIGTFIAKWRHAKGLARVQ